METLSYAALDAAGYQGYLLRRAPERILQFGEGNFLRAFTEHFVDVANEVCAFDTKVVLVQPNGNARAKLFAEQDNLYTLHLRGLENGAPVEESRVISCVSRCLNPREDATAILDCAGNPDLRYIVSNTTEAGIVFRRSDTPENWTAAAFPGKLARFLYERYTRFGGESAQGFVLLPCELIEDNGGVLKACVLRYAEHWGLGADFSAWVARANLFCSTLVDRIVPGYPGEEAAQLDAASGYADALRDTCEPFALWAIEGPDWLREALPFQKAGLPVLITPDHKPYKVRKVRILNGAHTALAAAALLCGLETVGEAMADPLLLGYVHRTIFGEIIPTLDLPVEELTAFAAAVEDRFRNPFIRHALFSITLNTAAKWRARVLPSITEALARTGSLPPLLTFSFAAVVQFLRTWADAKDDQGVLDFFSAHRADSDEALISTLCARVDFWGMDLATLPGFAAEATAYLAEISASGARAALTKAMDGGLAHA